MYYRILLDKDFFSYETFNNIGQAFARAYEYILSYPDTSIRIIKFEGEFPKTRTIKLFKPQEAPLSSGASET